jgi:hypothetical protein
MSRSSELAPRLYAPISISVATRVAALGSGRCVSLSRRSVWRVPSMARATRNTDSDAGREVGHSLQSILWLQHRAFEIDVLMSNASGLN